MIAGCVVEKTNVGVADGSYGTAITAFESSAPLELIGSRLVSNATAGLSLQQTAGSVVDSVIIDIVTAKFIVEDLDHQPGEDVNTLVFGDGVVALGEKALHMKRSLVWTQARAGLLISGAMSADVRSSRLAAGQWGIADQDGAKLLMVNTLLDHNGQNRGSDSGLAIALPPSLAQ